MKSIIILYLKKHFKIVFFKVFILMVSINAYSQNPIMLEGWIENNFGSSLEGVHVINRGMKIGLISHTNGHFSIPVEVGDSVLFTHVGYKSRWVHVSENFLYPNHQIKLIMVSDTFELAETVICPFPSSYIEFKNMVATLQMPEEKLSSDFDALHAPVYNPQGGIVIQGPISLIYSLFSKESKQLRKMNEINQAEGVRSSLFAKVSKEIMLKNFELNSDLELEIFLHLCQLSNDFIQKSSSIEIYNELYSCYIAHKMQKNE